MNCPKKFNLPTGGTLCDRNECAYWDNYGSQCSELAKVRINRILVNQMERIADKLDRIGTRLAR